MRSFTSLDIMYMLKEISFLEGSIISKIQHDKESLILTLHKNGKNLLRIGKDKFYLIKEKETQPPNPFVMYLRKRLEQGRVKSIKQIEFERIINIEITNKDKTLVKASSKDKPSSKETSKIITYNLVIELFGEGNIILLENNIILNAFRRKKYRDRIIKQKEKYNLPPSIQSNISELGKSEKPIVKELAVNYGLGGIYAEEICHNLKLDKNSKEINQKQISEIKKSIKEIKSKKLSPNISEGEYYPINLNTKNKEKNFKTFSEAISSLIKTKNPYEKEIERIKVIIKKQEEQLKKLIENTEREKTKGNLIYENYQKVEEEIKKHKTNFDIEL